MRIRGLSPLTVRLTSWMLVLVTLPLVGYALLARNTMAQGIQEATSHTSLEMLQVLATGYDEDQRTQSLSSSELEVLSPGQKMLADGVTIPQPLVALMAQVRDGTWNDPTWRQWSVAWVTLPSGNLILSRAHVPEIETAVNKILQGLYIQIAALCVVLGIGAGSVLIFLVGEPVRILTEASGRMAQGDLSATVDSSRMVDDLMGLAQTFNQMSSRIRDLVSSLNTMNESLEAKVEERTSDLVKSNTELDATLKHLQTTQEQLKRTERITALGQLSANILHELNTPLAAIASAVRSQRSYLVHDLLGTLVFLSRQPETLRQAFLRLAAFPPSAGLLLKRKDERIIRAHLAEVLTAQGCPDPAAAARAAAAIGLTDADPDFAAIIGSPESLVFLERAEAFSSITNLSRVSELASAQAARVVAKLRGFLVGFGTEAETNVDVEATLEAALQILVGEGSPELTIVRRYAETTVRGSRLALTEVWSNLIKNALQAVNYRGVLELTTLAVEGGVEVRIADNGPGIPPELQGRIFEPFFTTKTSGEALGLGLDVVRSLVEHHRGAIAFESATGRTCFTVRLPTTLSSS